MKSLREVITELAEQVSIARGNHQTGVVDQLEKKIKRIQKRDPKGE